MTQYTLFLDGVSLWLRYDKELFFVTIYNL